MSNTVACLNPRICGVQSHQAGSTAVRECVGRANAMAAHPSGRGTGDVQTIASEIGSSDLSDPYVEAFGYPGDTKLSDIDDEDLQASGLDFSTEIRSEVDIIDNGGDVPTATVTFHDDLDFAKNRGDLDGLLDEDGYTTDETDKALEECYRDMLKSERYGIPDHIADSVQILPEGDGDEYYTVDVGTSQSDGDMTLEDLNEKVIAPMDAMMANYTDPGTFNHPYIWDDVRAKMGLGRG